MSHDPNYQPPAFIPLDIALSWLPLETPGRSAWPALAERIQRQSATPSPRARRAWPVAAALAAGLLLVAIVPRGTDLPAPAMETAPTTFPREGLAQLMQESSRLEALIAASDGGTSSASAAVFALELEDQLQQIDARLAGSDLDASRKQALWQQRVGLLRDYAGFESTRHWYAANGRNLDVSLVAAY